MCRVFLRTNCWIKAIEENFIKDNCRALYKYFTDLNKMLDYIENDDMEGLTIKDLK